MAEAAKAYSAIQGLTLELAVEQAVRPLATLYAAKAARLAYRDRRFAQTYRSELPPDFEHQLRARIDLQREEQATFPPFIKLLLSNELIAEVRPWDDLGVPMKRLRSDEASQLRIKVHNSATSLVLYGPNDKRLYARFWFKNLAPAPDDLRVEVTEPPPSGEKTTTSSAKLKASLEGIIDEVPFPPLEDRHHGWKKRWAQDAAAAINERHKAEPTKVKRTTWRSVENRANELGLWPK